MRWIVPASRGRRWPNISRCGANCKNSRMFTRIGIQNYRLPLELFAEKITEETAKIPPSAPDSAPPTATQAPVAAAPSAVNAEVEAQLGTCYTQFQQFQADNSPLQDQVERGARGATGRSDHANWPGTESIRSLMKENVLLMVGLGQGKTRAALVGAGAETEALNGATVAGGRSTCEPS